MDETVIFLIMNASDLSPDAHSLAGLLASIRTDRLEYGPAERAFGGRLIDLALAEDLGICGDLTALATIPEDARARGRFVARRKGVIAGMPLVTLLVERFGLLPSWNVLIADGGRVEPGSVLATIEGPARDLLALERTALNFLSRLSGVATLTARFVDLVQGTKAVVFDTRKTTPGWRVLEKQAVRCGGGRNHRLGLFDAVLIKDNHLAWLADDADPIGRAIASARVRVPRRGRRDRGQHAQPTRPRLGSATGHHSCGQLRSGISDRGGSTSRSHRAGDSLGGFRRSHARNRRRSREIGGRSDQRRRVDSLGPGTRHRS